MPVLLTFAPPPGFAWSRPRATARVGITWMCPGLFATSRNDGAAGCVIGLLESLHATASSAPPMTARVTRSLMRLSSISEGKRTAANLGVSPHRARGGRDRSAARGYHATDLAPRAQDTCLHAEKRSHSCW